MSEQDISESPDIRFVGVSKWFGDVVAVDKIDLSVERGAFFSFLGPSGCGKTTSLRLIAGFDQPTEGDVFISGTSVVGIPSHKRPVNMVFQNYALFPHMNVADNIAYGLRQRNPKPPKQEIAKRVDETLELVRLSGFGKRKSWELSGGQQQRVALARALINHPTVLLLDEPLAALDRKLRREMQMELQTLQREVGITFILVTHDQEEALSMSDRICIMREGQIIQSGSPRELYDEPVNRYVADFVGKTNFFNGKVVTANKSSISINSESCAVLVGVKSKGAPTPKIGSNACVAVRPEMISISAADEKDNHADIAIKGHVKNRIFLGEHSEYLIVTEGFGDVLVLSPKTNESNRRIFAPGDHVSISWMPEAVLVLEDT
ncbi:MAG TPA: ABC transporter ATP-binding protein [Candidatus Marinimicrobia bacterium]|jgi:spermidine/putrescine transport system ATP-binding protein|nr:ABC transporter ATP-binding protein [Candidatus Neomarinimicrobiota bacterium]